ncbi:MAG TPA: hypothetical protein VHP37_06870 [Burkholderiales bacterium]|nr:hypothetical protein [Burkholderiales bacterium]
MAKPKSGRCVHCLATVDAITDDHLFPRAWYPAVMPHTLEKWTVPACRACNHEYGRIEEDLLLRFAACLNPDGPATERILMTVRNSMDHKRATSRLDALKRIKKRRRFEKLIKPVEQATDLRRVPEIGPVQPKDRFAIVVSAASIRRFVEKLVRGTVYLTENRYIETGRIGVSMMEPERAAEVQELLEQFGELHERGRAIRIRKAVAAEAPRDPIFVFDLWDQFRVYAYVEDELRESGR